MINGFVMTDCPSCGKPAEVLELFRMDSTNGPVLHGRVHCLADTEHRYLFPVVGLEMS